MKSKIDVWIEEESPNYLNQWENIKSRKDGTNEKNDSIKKKKPTERHHNVWKRPAKTRYQVLESEMFLEKSEFYL